MKTSRQLLIVQFCLLAFLCTYGYAQDRVHNPKCTHEDFPDTLNNPALLDFNNELHIHGEYFVNLTQTERRLPFVFTQQSAVRFYVAPHQVDVDLWLFNNSNPSSPTQMGFSGLGVGGEEVIARTLPPGSYYVRFSFFGVWIGSYDPSECESITMEVQIVPVTRLQSRASDFTCPKTSQMPTLDLSAIVSGKSTQYSYDSAQNDSTAIFTSQANASTNRFDVAFLKSYHFTLPELNSSISYYRLHASLEFEFILGDSLGLLLINNIDDVEPDLRCATDRSCSVGHNWRMNQNSLRSILVPGNYTLWIYDRTGEKDGSFLNNCIPFSFRFSMEVVQGTESFVNCDAPRLPTSLIPGLFDEPEGFIHYSENVYMDLENVDMTFHSP